MTAGTALVATTALGTLIAREPGTAGARLAALTGVWATCIAAGATFKGGRQSTASWLILGGITAIVMWRASATGGLSAPVAPLYLMLAVMGALLCGLRGALLMTLVAGAAAGVLAAIEETGNLPEPEFGYSAASTLVYVGIALLLTLLIPTRIVRTLRLRAERVREAEGQLERLAADLQERVKELTLLHHAARILDEGSLDPRELLERLAPLIPPAFQYPELCEARVTYGTAAATTPGWVTGQGLDQAFATSFARGTIEVLYREPRQFLAEEHTLLVSLAEMLTNRLEVEHHRRELEAIVEARTTELADSLERQRELERLRDDLVQMVVHDMRSPLSALVMSLLIIKPQVPKDLAEVLDAAVSAGNDLARMANTMLDVSRLEAGQMALEPELCDLTALADAVRRQFAFTPQQVEIAVVADGPIEVACDQAIIRRVLENLVSNGLRHSPPRGHLWISVSTATGFAEIAVQDEGPGIPPEDRDRLFQKFGTLASRRDQSYHSVGLGLAFCKLAVEAHLGMIRFEPASPTGSVFIVQLPRDATPAGHPGLTL